MSAPAFADPVFQSQATFRAVLEAMSRPGRIVSCGAGLAPPAPLSLAAAAILLTLCDYETPLWLSPAYATSEVGAWARFHTGAPAAPTPDRAAFALIDLSKDTLDLSRFAQGAPDFPDRSTTIVAEVATLAATGPLQLKGPGVKGVASLGLAPLPADFLAQWLANGAGFPLGVDMIFTAEARAAAFPRSTRVSGAA